MIKLLIIALFIQISIALEIEHYLMPKDGISAESNIIYNIKNAKKSIKVAMFMVTNKRLVNALIEKHKRAKIDIKLIADSSFNKKNIKKSKLNLLLQEKGIHVYIVKGLKKKKDRYGILHSKLIIIDDKIVYLGSTNWTNYAFKYNYEILIKISDYTTAKLYSIYFDEILRNSIKYKGIK